jgi:hypothetical protein
MPPAYAVRAAVIDLRTDSPRPTDRFAADTNVWGWRHYLGLRVSAAGVPAQQALEYPPYLDLARAAGAALYHAAFQLAELTHLIETNELEAYAAGVGPLTRKEYRHNHPAERARVVREVEKVWNDVTAESAPMPLQMDAASASAALARLPSEPVDGYDLFLLKSMAASGVTQLLSDDGDCCCVAGLTLFTANARGLTAARAQGRLRAR